MATTQEGIGEKVREEFKALGILFAYLAVLFVTFTTYKRLLLAEYSIPFFQYGYAFLEALILAKVVMLGRMAKVGETRFRNRPLIVPALYKTFCFSLLVLAFSTLEHFVKGWWHGQPASKTLEEFFGAALWEGLARMTIVFAGFVPLFAAGELGRYLDAEKVFRLFFVRRPAEGEAIDLMKPRNANG